MKKFSSGLSFFFHKFLLPAAGIFSLLVLIVCIFSETGSIRTDKMYVLLFAACGAAAVNLIFYINKISVYFKAATHFILLGIVILGVLYFSDYMKRGNWVLLLVGYVIAYAIICPSILLLRAAQAKKSREQKGSDYDKKFK